MKSPSFRCICAVFALAGSGFAASFDITGTSNTAQTLASGQTGNVSSTGILSISGSTVAVTVTGNSTLTNSGLIEQTGSGRGIRVTGSGVTFTVTNNASGTISTANADAFQVTTNSTITLHNYGDMISLNSSAAGNQAIDWNAITSASNTLNNYSGGLIEATAADAVRPGINGVIDNAGTIRAIPVTEGSSPSRDASSSDGIDAQANSGIQITNSGLITGRHAITGGEAAENFTISIMNNVGGEITAANGAGVNIDGAVTSASVVSHTTVVNSGTITGNFDSTKYDIGDGDGVDVDGTVHLTNNGIIRGIGAAGGGNNSEGVSIGGGTIINNSGAEIYGQNPTASGAAGNGILVDDSNGGDAYAAATVTNAGTIRGHSGFGIRIIGTFADTITNDASGIIRGAGAGAAIQTGGGGDTVTTRGTITGDNGSAIDLEADDDILNIEGGGATITGSVSGGTGNNTANIDPGTGNSFSYADSLSNFATVEIKSGTVTLSGANTYTGSTKISGGALVLGGAGRIHSGSNLNLDGGTLKMESIGAANGQTFASLALSEDSIIDLDDTTTLSFEEFGDYSADTTLAILHYNASLANYAIRFHEDLTANADFLAFIEGTSVNGLDATYVYTGGYTNVTGVVAVPEPATIAILAVAGGLFLLYRGKGAFGRFFRRARMQQTCHERNFARLMSERLHSRQP